MNRRDFLGTMAAFGISINTPIIFGQDTSDSNNDNDKTFSCDVEQPISIAVITTFDTEEILQLGQLRTYEQLKDDNLITTLELIYKNRTEKYKTKDQWWINNCKPPIGMRHNNLKTYLSKTQNIFRIYMKHEDSWTVCQFNIEEKIEDVYGYYKSVPVKITTDTCWSTYYQCEPYHTYIKKDSK